MSDFCSRCGTEIGWFSRKRARQPDGSIIQLCKTCAARRSQEAAVAPVGAESLAPAPALPPPPPAAPAITSPPPSGDPTTRIAQLLVKHFHRETGIDILGDKMATDRILQAARKAADELRSIQATEVNLPFLTADATGPKHLQVRIDRTQLD
jgi:Hsp70 protein